MTTPAALATAPAGRIDQAHETAPPPKADRPDSRADPAPRMDTATVAPSTAAALPTTLGLTSASAPATAKSITVGGPKGVSAEAATATATAQLIDPWGHKASARGAMQVS